MELAAAEHLNAPYLCWVSRLMLLPPDLVEAMLDVRPLEGMVMVGGGGVAGATSAVSRFHFFARSGQCDTKPETGRV